MFFNFIQEIIFDHEDEYNFKSTKFNPKKVLFLLLLITSLICNVFFISSFIRLGNKYLTAQAEIKTLKDSKINKQLPSDSKKP